MNLKSQILKDEFQKAFKLRNKSEKDLEIEKERYLEEIEFSKNNIEIYLDRLREYHKNKTKLIVNIRNIIEEESNHEDNLICNKLKENKEVEYNRAISNLNRLLKEDITRNEEMQINHERNLIKQKNENYRYNENISISCTDEAIEKGRREIIKKTINFLERNKTTKDHIQYLKILMEESNSSK